VRHHHVVAVARHVEDLHLRAVRQEPLRQRETVHAGHHDVGHQEIDGLARPAHEAERFDGTIGDEDTVAPVGQDVMDERTNLLLVFHEQDGFRSGDLRVGCGNGGGRCAAAGPALHVGVSNAVCRDARA
jgi:hypothetical protein